VTVHAAWQDFPTDDVEADTALMNRRLEDLIATMPAQYFWVHQRFKTRPPGAAPIY
jgi:KDO2-lipid IV(A) lauroyltransferase